MARKMNHTELLVRIDERVEALSKNMEEKVLPVVTTVVPTLRERVNSLRTVVYSLAGLLAFLQLVFNFWPERRTDRQERKPSWTATAQP